MIKFVVPLFRLSGFVAPRSFILVQDSVLLDQSNTVDLAKLQDWILFVSVGYLASLAYWCRRRSACYKTD